MKHFEKELDEDLEKIITRGKKESSCSVVNLFAIMKYYEMLEEAYENKDFELVKRLKSEKEGYIEFLKSEFSNNNPRLASATIKSYKSKD